MSIYREESAEWQRLDVRPQGDASKGSFVLNKEAGKFPRKTKGYLRWVLHISMRSLH